MVNVCVVGCLHGELDKMYADVRLTEQKLGISTDIVLCCGDFQAIRNESDLTTLSVPEKYRRMGDFWRYYSGEKRAPYLTVFVGGNHEASNYVQELPYGGWVAPRIWYMGYAGVVRYRGLRIAGLSGIYKRHDYYTGHHEHAPYDDQSRITAYHTRAIDAFRLGLLTRRGQGVDDRGENTRWPVVDICLSHDWPQGVYNYFSKESLDTLKKQKPHLKSDIEAGFLGSHAGREVILALRPKYWFAAHMHYKIGAVVDYEKNAFGCSDYSNARQPTTGRLTAAIGVVNNVKMKNETVNNNQKTRFLALEKCMPKAPYMQFLNIDPVDGGTRGVGDESDDSGLYLDPEWLCILRATNHLMSISKTTTFIPVETCNERWNFSVTDADLKDLKELFNNQFKIPDNFVQTAPIHHEEYEEASSLPKPVAIHANPQTDLICAMLELINPNAEFLGRSCSLSELSKKLTEKQLQYEDSEDEGDGNGNSDSNCSSCNEDEYDSCLEKKTGEKALILADTKRKAEINPEEINIDDNDAEIEEEQEGEGRHFVGTDQYDPTDYRTDESDEDLHEYCPSDPFFVT